MRNAIPVEGLLTGWAVMITLHVGLGWAWTVPGGVLVGVWQPRQGGILGGVSGALGWATLVVYSVAAAPGATRTLIDALGAVGGNIPGEALVGASVLLGGVLGALGGKIGAESRALWSSIVGSTS